MSSDYFGLKEHKYADKHYKIDMNKITWHATVELLKLDDSFVGTPHYMGITYFWDHEYKHYLRDLTPKERVIIHHALLSSDLDPSEVSGQHASVILPLREKLIFKRIRKK